MFWDTLIQNNMVRASPKDIDDMQPGIIFALLGLWEGRNKNIQESMPKPKDKDKGDSKPRNASRNR